MCQPLISCMRSEAICLLVTESSFTRSWKPSRSILEVSRVVSVIVLKGILQKWAEPSLKPFAWLPGNSFVSRWRFKRKPPQTATQSIITCNNTVTNPHTHTITHHRPLGKSKEHLCAFIHLCDWHSPQRPPSLSFPDNGFPRNNLELMSCNALLNIPSVWVRVCGQGIGKRQGDLVSFK